MHHSRSLDVLFNPMEGTSVSVFFLCLTQYVSGMVRTSLSDRLLRFTLFILLVKAVSHRSTVSHWSTVGLAENSVLSSYFIIERTFKIMIFDFFQSEIIFIFFIKITERRIMIPSVRTQEELFLLMSSVWPVNPTQIGVISLNGFWWIHRFTLSITSSMEWFGILLVQQEAGCFPPLMRTKGKEKLPTKSRSTIGFSETERYFRSAASFPPFPNSPWPIKRKRFLLPTKCWVRDKLNIVEYFAS